MPSDLRFSNLDIFEKYFCQIVIFKIRPSFHCKNVTRIKMVIEIFLMV